MEQADKLLEVTSQLQQLYAGGAPAKSITPATFWSGIMIGIATTIASVAFFFGTLEADVVNLDKSLNEHKTNEEIHVTNDVTRTMATIGNKTEQLERRVDALEKSKRN